MSRKTHAPAKESLNSKPSHKVYTPASIARIERMAAHILDIGLQTAKEEGSIAALATLAEILGANKSDLGFFGKVAMHLQREAQGRLVPISEVADYQSSNDRAH